MLVVQGQNKATLGGVSVASGKRTKKRKHKKHWNTSAQKSRNISLENNVLFLPV